jgi:DNA-binding XRE family transcriptional regulator
MPAGDLKRFSEETSPDAIILTATSADRATRVHEAITALSDLDKDPVILLGGSGICEDDYSGQLVAQDLSSGLSLLEKNLNIGTDFDGLDQVLIGIGNNIQNLRKARGMNQGQLADIAGVDRAYISLVENGKQNLTLGALVKLSESLSVSVSALVPASTRGTQK